MQYYGKKNQKITFHKYSHNSIGKCLPNSQHKQRENRNKHRKECLSPCQCVAFSCIKCNARVCTIIIVNQPLVQSITVTRSNWLVIFPL